jgi:vacuolar-type H+-ATPase subunit E/Vma4
MAKSLDDNVQALSRTVLDEAESKAAQILNDARVKADAVRQRAQAQASAERRSILEHATREADRIRSQSVASTHLKARTGQLVQRERLIEDVFQAAREQLASIQQREDYAQIAVLLLRETLLHLNAEASRVHADPTTSRYFTSQVLEQMADELKMKIQTGQPLPQQLGVIAETLDGHRRYDNTLQTRLSRIQNSLRAHVYDVLTGKSS